MVVDWAEAETGNREMAAKNRTANSFFIAKPHLLSYGRWLYCPAGNSGFYHVLYSRWHYFVKFLVIKRIYDFAVCVQQFYYLIFRTPHRACASQINAPSVSKKISVIFVCVYTPTIIQILSD